MVVAEPAMYMYIARALLCLHLPLHHKHDEQRELNENKFQTKNTIIYTNSNALQCIHSTSTASYTTYIIIHVDASTLYMYFSTEGIATAYNVFSIYLQLVYTNSQ